MEVPQGRFMTMQKPVRLISGSTGGELQVNQKALDVLNSIKQPVVVVSIVGMYRTGKSYLMNRLAGQQTGFPLRSVAQSETKGIWMWCLPHPHRNGQTLVLLDTEGLGEEEKGEPTQDTWIFVLAVLLSSTLVYNSMGAINNEALMSLHYVTELTERIKVKSTEEKEDFTAAEFVHFFPTFVWAVRDFTQELKIAGKPVTADEYLEFSLKTKIGHSRQVGGGNNSRECIRNYFPTRKCFVFNQPASAVKLRISEKLTDADLEPGFVRQTLDFCSYVFMHSKEKTTSGGVEVTGQMLGTMAVTYVDAIRSGSIPCLENAVAALSQIENRAAVEEPFAHGEQLETKTARGPKANTFSAVPGCDVGPIEEPVALPSLSYSERPQKASHQRTQPEKRPVTVPSSPSSSGYSSLPQRAVQQRTQADQRPVTVPSSPASSGYSLLPQRAVQQRAQADKGRPVAMSKPACLIENTEAGELQVNQEALDILNSITQPVVVVSIVGMYRTGKSYLMNRLAGKTSGFSLGSTIQSETKGIWMWCMPHPRKKKQTLVLLDTEGLGDVEKANQTHDTWIFALAVLLSSTLVYNSMGTINNEAVMSLHYVTELTNHIRAKKKGEGKPCDYIPFFPIFVWAVRDFSLELKAGGKTITADEYLERALKHNKNGNPQMVGVSNKARECIRNYFPTRKCFVFDQPASKELLRTLEELQDSELDRQFLKQTSAFLDYIFSSSKEKTMGGIAVTGRRLGSLAETYVKVIRSGKVVCLQNAMTALSQNENSMAVEESFALYWQLLGERMKLHTRTQEEFTSVHDSCLSEALHLFMKCSFKDKNQKYQRELMERVREVYERKRAENEEMSENHCTVLLLQLEESVNMDPEESYMQPGGYRRFRDQLFNIVKLYKTQPAKGVKAEEVLNNYLCDKNRLGSAILTADRNLTEQQRRMEEQRAQMEEQKQRAEAATEQQRALEERVNHIERVHEENEKQLMEKMVVFQAFAQAETQNVMQQRLREQRALLEEGYKQKADQLNDEIQQLREKMNSKKSNSGHCVLS